MSTARIVIKEKCIFPCTYQTCVNYATSQLARVVYTSICDNINRLLYHYVFQYCINVFENIFFNIILKSLKTMPVTTVYNVII